MSIYTRKELDKKATAYIVTRIADGYKGSFNDEGKTQRRNFVVLEKKDGKDIIWQEFISYGIDDNGDYKFSAEVHLNGKRQNRFNWKFFAVDSNTFSDMK